MFPIKSLREDSRNNPISMVMPVSTACICPNFFTTPSGCSKMVLNGSMVLKFCELGGTQYLTNLKICIYSTFFQILKEKDGKGFFQNKIKWWTRAVFFVFVPSTWAWHSWFSHLNVFLYGMGCIKKLQTSFDFTIFFKGWIHYSECEF